MNQCKYTLSVNRNASWKVAFHFGKSVGTGELYFLDGVFTARDEPIAQLCRYANIADTDTAGRIANTDTADTENCADISDTNTGICPFLFTAFF